jgi:AcrR family transcriptional regulator
MPSSAVTEGRRWRRRKEARPSEIVAAALEVFAERGFAAARLDDVAHRAGVSKGTLYLYFDSKEELFKAVVRQALVPNIERAERLIVRYPGPTGELVAQMLRGLIAAVAGSRLAAIPKLVIAESGNFPELARFYLDEVIRRGFRVMAAVLQRGIDRGEFRPVDVPNAVRTVIAPLLLTVLWKTSFEAHDERTLDVDAFLDTYLDILLRGLAATDVDRGGGGP